MKVYRIQTHQNSQIPICLPANGITYFIIVSFHSEPFFNRIIIIKLIQYHKAHLYDGSFFIENVELCDIIYYSPEDKEFYVRIQSVRGDKGE